MGRFYLGVAILLTVAAAIFWLVAFSIGAPQALVVFAGAMIMTAAAHIGFSLIDG